MKLIYIFILFTSLLNAKVYYSKVEPYELRNISANVGGLVTFIDEDKIGKKLGEKAYVKLDTELDLKELEQIKIKLHNLQNMLTSNEKKLVNYEQILEKKRVNYDKVKDLKIKSIVEKDREFYDLVASENQFLSTSNEINNLKIQIADLELRKAVLIRTLKDKNLKAKGFMLYAILVRAGQVVNMGAPLAQIADISKAKLTIYLDYEDLETLDTKKVYIDGKETSYKVTRLLTISDAKNISKYKAQIIIKAPKSFSKLAKIELK